jgi:hypothetical protein
MYETKFNKLCTHIPEQMIHLNKSGKEEAAGLFSFKK